MNLFELLNNPQIAEWFFNIFIKSTIIILVGFFIIKHIPKQKAPLISRISLVIILMILIIPGFSIIDNLIKNFNINADKIHLISNEYIIVSLEDNSIDTQTGKALNIIVLFNIIGFIWTFVFFYKTLQILHKIYYLYKFKNTLLNKKAPLLKHIFPEIFKYKTLIEPTIYLSSTIHSPITFGFFKPAIVIPEELYINLDKNELKSIIFHEMSHIVRKDNLSGLVQQIAIAFYWWNPFLYIINREFSIASEYICDNNAIKATSPKLYAKTIVSLIEKTKTLNEMPGIAGISSSHINLKDRIKIIIQKERKMETKLKNYLTVIIVIISIIILGLLSGQKFVFAKEKTTKPEVKIIKVEKKSDNTDKKPQSLNISIKQAKKTKHVNPIYPQEALKARIQGIVHLNTIVNIEGKITKCEIISGHPLLNDAAIHAVKQWEYKPFIKDGKKIPVNFKVTINFTGINKLNNIKKITLKQAKRKKYVAPVFPEVAKKEKLSSKVVLEATTNKEGKVVNCKVISGHPVFNQAAIDAVMQWEYGSYLVNGEKKGVKFTVEVNFTNSKDEGK